MYNRNRVINLCKDTINNKGTLYDVEKCLTDITDYEITKEHYELVVRNNKNKEYYL
jgi:hypothetical protein